MQFDLRKFITAGTRPVSYTHLLLGVGELGILHILVQHSCGAHGVGNGTGTADAAAGAAHAFQDVYKRQGLYYHYGVRKQLLPEKMFGVFEHRVTRPSNPLAVSYTHLDVYKRQGQHHATTTPVKNV